MKMDGVHSNAPDMDLDQWRRQREWTLVNCCVGAFAFGLSLTIYYPTEYYYFRDTMKLENADIYYGLSWACLCGSGILSSFVGSFYADKTKNIRELCLWVNLLNVVGNIMYVLYFSPYLVLFGQFLCGTAAARNVAVVGEVSRIYEADKLTQKLAFMGIFSTIGSILGPCSTYIFHMVDTQVGNWKLNISNMVGIVMAVLYVLQLVLNFFTLQNLSKEYNLKKDVTEGLLRDTPMADKSDESETDDEIGEKPLMEEIDEISFLDKYKNATLALLRNKRSLFLYGLCFFASYTRASMILVSPIQAARYLKWMQTNLATFNIITTFAGAVPTALAFSALSKIVNDFYFLLYTMVALVLALIFLALFTLIPSSHVITTVLLYASGIFTLMSVAGFHIVSRSMLAKFVPENIQTVAEAIRNSLFELSYLIAGLCVKLPVTYLPQFLTSAAVVIVLAIVWLIVNREPYKNIEIIRPD